MGKIISNPYLEVFIMIVKVYLLMLIYIYIVLNKGIVVIKVEKA